ncbi:unnamed protein product [Echinostoma caproni]|uniref:Uncharacterized protein n=1 Tax=Echinostoma caproni TaxID=27848 RepID=A0A183A9I9_9TREM|nr:unnamed protein product [Echinostoma caproni]
MQRDPQIRPMRPPGSLPTKPYGPVDDTKGNALYWRRTTIASLRSGRMKEKKKSSSLQRTDPNEDLVKSGVKSVTVASEDKSGWLGRHNHLVHLTMLVHVTGGGHARHVMRRIASRTAVDCPESFSYPASSVSFTSCIS